MLALALAIDRLAGNFSVSWWPVVFLCGASLAIGLQIALTGLVCEYINSSRLLTGTPMAAVWDQVAVTGDAARERDAVADGGACERDAVARDVARETSVHGA